MVDSTTIRQRLEMEESDHFINRIKLWLEQENPRSVSTRDSKITVSEALRLWSTRLKNTDITGQDLEGVRPFVERLEGLARNRKLQQFAFVGSATGGNLFFEAMAPHHFVGAVLFHVKRP